MCSKFLFRNLYQGKHDSIQREKWPGSLFKFSFVLVKQQNWSGWEVSSELHCFLNYYAQHSGFNTSQETSPFLTAVTFLYLPLWLKQGCRSLKCKQHRLFLVRNKSVSFISFHSSMESVTRDYLFSVPGLLDWGIRPSVNSSMCIGFKVMCLDPS